MMSIILNRSSCREDLDRKNHLAAADNQIVWLAHHVKTEEHIEFAQLQKLFFFLDVHFSYLFSA